METHITKGCPVHAEQASQAVPVRESCPVGTRGECELFRSVFTLNTLLMRVADRMTGEIGLTGSRWLLLSAVVWSDEAPTITELSRRCLLSVQNVSRMIASMEREGLVERVQIAGEGRAQRVTLTERGHQILERTVPLAERLREGFLAGLGETDVAALSERMDRLVGNLMRMEQELSE